MVAMSSTTLPISVLLASSRWITSTAVCAARTADRVAVAMSLLTSASRCAEPAAVLSGYCSALCQSVIVPPLAGPTPNIAPRGCRSR
jgi:hypothetical protein